MDDPVAPLVDYNVTSGNDKALDDVAEIKPTAKLPIYLTLLFYFIGSCICCTCVVFGLGVAHDNGDWDDTPNFLKS